MRQEKGQDIAGACGQLALVNPGKGSENSASAGESRDIEDFMGNSSKKGKVRPPSRGKGRAALGSGTNEVDEVNIARTGEYSWNDGLQGINLNKLYCYVNVALPIALVSLGYFARK